MSKASSQKTTTRSLSTHAASHHRLQDRSRNNFKHHRTCFGRVISLAFNIPAALAGMLRTRRAIYPGGPPKLEQSSCRFSSKGTLESAVVSFGCSWDNHPWIVSDIADRNCSQHVWDACQEIAATNHTICAIANYTIHFKPCPFNQEQSPAVRIECLGEENNSSHWDSSDTLNVSAWIAEHEVNCTKHAPKRLEVPTPTPRVRLAPSTSVTQASSFASRLASTPTPIGTAPNTQGIVPTYPPSNTFAASAALGGAIAIGVIAAGVGLYKAVQCWRRRHRHYAPHEVIQLTKPEPPEKCEKVEHYVQNETKL